MEQLGALLPTHSFSIQQSQPAPFYQAPSMANNKRNLNFQHHQHQHQHQNDTNWNPNIWDWDRVNFVAKRLDTPSSEANQDNNKVQEIGKPPSHRNKSMNEDSNNLTTLNLGGNLYSADDLLPKPNKRLRLGSPPASSSYPMCQVDDCTQDLSNAKDYHRRHKVCQLHSKTTNTLVANQMQRFCQQCSRFHPLPEFDEGKRSCRRRLAGHNRRRRKTQQEEVSSQLLLPEGQKSTANGELDVLNLLTVLTHLQGNTPERISNGSSIPDRDRVFQMLSKINSLPIAANSASRLPSAGGFDLNVSEQVPLEQPIKFNGSTSALTTTGSLAVLSAPIVVSSPDALTVPSHRSNQGSGNGKIMLNGVDHGTGFSIPEEVIPSIPSVRVVCTTNIQSPIEVSNSQVEETWPNLPLQLFSSSPENETPLKFEASRKYFFSDNSDAMKERSPSYSPPVVQKLFPLQSESNTMKYGNLLVSGEDTAVVAASTAHGWSSSLAFFKRSSGRAEHRPIQVTSKVDYTSSSGSDHSPSSSNSDVQERTGRIIFKLFDKGPSGLPATLKEEIRNWLSKSPSDMESYIRPGCLVLSVYIAMPVATWAQLQEELFRFVKVLVQDSVSDIWRSGRFLVNMDRQLASHINGKFRVCKSLRTLSAPELLIVSPLAVVSEQETSLVLRGRNLSIPGTKIHCTYMGKYLSKNVEVLAHTAHDDKSIQTFLFPSVSPCVQGRCFIEVENGFKGNSFPVIISDANICRELRLLESELDDGARVDGIVLQDQIRDFRHQKTWEEALHFLNELGWLFQKNIPSNSEGLYFSLNRFKFLLIFSVERGWSAVVRTLLDIFVESNAGEDGLSRESLETLGGIHLLNRAVKRKSINMVNLLIHYKVICQSDSSKKYLFSPNKAGHGGITPLHLAACKQDSEHMVDALTNDPEELGLTCWTSQLDANGHSAYAYALFCNNHSYNVLVARKLADLKSAQVSISIGDSVFLDRSWIIAERGDRPSSQSLRGKRSCARCSVVTTSHYKQISGAQRLLHRPYVHSMLTIAAVCVCVCLFLRGSPDIGRVAPFKWENVHFGTR